jgi:hypothetical protein
MSQAGKVAPESAPPRGFLFELRDAVSVRTFFLVFGVLLLQLGFILSYVGAFHAPKPVRIPIGVVASASAGPTIASELNRIPSDPLRAVVEKSRVAARREIESTSLSAALVISPTSATDTLLVASAGGSSVEAAVEQIITEAEARTHRGVRVVDVVPLQPGDGRGPTGFYLVIRWLVGGYLVASLLGISGGSRPATLRRAAIRLLAMVPYAIAGLVGGDGHHGVPDALRGDRNRHHRAAVRRARQSKCRRGLSAGLASSVLARPQ